MENENIDKEFAHIANQIGDLEPGKIAGANESIMRENMGDVEYEKWLDVRDKDNASTLATNFARAAYISAMAQTHLGIAFFLRVSILLGTAWSIWFWVH